MLMLMVTTNVMGSVRDHRKASKSISGLPKESGLPKSVKIPYRYENSCSGVTYSVWTLNPIRTALSKLKLRLKYSSSRKAPVYNMKKLWWKNRPEESCVHASVLKLPDCFINKLRNKCSRLTSDDFFSL